MDPRRNWPPPAWGWPTMQVAWRKGNVIGENRTREKVVQGTLKGWTLGRRQRGQHECNKWLRKWDLKEVWLESTGNFIETFRKTNGLEITKRIARSTVGMQKIKEWTLWRSRPPPKQKKRSYMECTPEMWEHQPLWIVSPHLWDLGSPEKCWCFYTWTDWNLLRELLGMNALKEGVVVAIREWSQQERPNDKKTSWAEPSEKKEWWYTNRLFGANSLKEWAMWHDPWKPQYDHLLGGASLSMFPWQHRIHHC
jgi:hypothetical protein